MAKNGFTYIYFIKHNNGSNANNNYDSTIHFAYCVPSCGEILHVYSS